MYALKCLLAIFLAAVPLSAYAQISWQPNFNLAPAMMQARVLNPCPDGRCRGKRADTPRQFSRPNQLVNSSAKLLAKLNFAPSLQLRQRNLASFVAKARVGDPEGSKKMAQLFASTDIIGAIGKGIAPYGLQTSNLADAYTVYWTNAWLGSRGRNDTLSKQQIAAVKNQAVDAMIGLPAFVSATDAQKQEMAEAMLVQAALIESIVENAKSDPALMSKVKVAIAQGAKAMGLDLYRMNLTSNGFVPAGSGGAVDDVIPPQLGVEQALASNTPLDSAPNFALIAAAGGAGLGGMFLLGKAMGRKN